MKIWQTKNEWKRQREKQRKRKRERESQRGSERELEQSSSRSTENHQNRSCLVYSNGPLCLSLFLHLSLHLTLTLAIRRSHGLVTCVGPLVPHLQLRVCLYTSYSFVDGFLCHLFYLTFIVFFFYFLDRSSIRFSGNRVHVYIYSYGRWLICCCY